MGSNYINITNYTHVCVRRTVLGSNYIKDLKAIVGRGGAFTFAPPPGYNTLKDLPPPTYSQPAPGTT